MVELWPKPHRRLVKVRRGGTELHAGACTLPPKDTLYTLEPKPSGQLERPGPSFYALQYGSCLTHALNASTAAWKIKRIRSTEVCMTRHIGIKKTSAEMISLYDLGEGCSQASLPVDIPVHTCQCVIKGSSPGNGIRPM